MCCKDAPSEEFLRAFNAVRQGKPYLSHEVASEIAFSETLATSSLLQSLTVRELQTLALISEGKSYGDIAEEAQHQLQDRGQHHVADQEQARRKNAAGADAHCHPASAGAIAAAGLTKGEASASPCPDYCVRYFASAGGLMSRSDGTLECAVE